jgi:acyl-[acyl-carrier-protein] desaturase
MRDDLGPLVEELEKPCDKFEVVKHRRLGREARGAEKRTANEAVASSF